MELYMLIEWDNATYEHSTIGVFDSKEKAEEAADWMNKNVSTHAVHFEVCDVPSILNRIDNDVLDYYGLLDEEGAQA